jgi:hypothetical protein
MIEEHEDVADVAPATDSTPEKLSRDEMLDQLQVMARQIAGDAPPSLREASVVAAELAAIAARGTGPVAKTLGELTNDASLRLADRLETYAAGVRETDGLEAVPSDEASPSDSDPLVATEPSDAVTPDGDTGNRE